MQSLPILKFEPRLVSIVWGGRNLERVMNKVLPESVPVGESWEICDLDDYQSVVSGGAFDGKTLEQLLQTHKDDILGTAKLLEGRFPLLFKFIDAQKTLSVQVHPDDAACKIIGQGARPKTEAWYIIDCDDDAVLYAGLAKGVTKDVFEQALKDGTVEQYLNKKSVKPGDYIFLPSGTIHAIGAGIVLAEVQQSSNTTYRVFDWNRVGMDGKPRELHVEQALLSIHFDESGEPALTPPASGNPGTMSDFFEMETISFESGDIHNLSSTGPVAVMVVKGSGGLTVKCGRSIVPVALGETVLVPASLAGDITLHLENSSEQIQCVLTRIP